MLGLQSLSHNTRSADTDIDNGICLCHTMERPRHERIIVRCITKYNQLGTTDAVVLLRIFCRLQDDLTHQLNSIHVKSCFC